MRDARFQKLFNTHEYHIKDDRDRTSLFNSK